MSAIEKLEVGRPVDVRDAAGRSEELGPEAALRELVFGLDGLYPFLKRHDLSGPLPEPEEVKKWRELQKGLAEKGIRDEIESRVGTIIDRLVAAVPENLRPTPAGVEYLGRFFQITGTEDGLTLERVVDQARLILLPAVLNKKQLSDSTHVWDQRIDDFFGQFPDQAYREGRHFALTPPWQRRFADQDELWPCPREDLAPAASLRREISWRLVKVLVTLRSLALKIGVSSDAINLAAKRLEISPIPFWPKEYVQSTRGVLQEEAELIEQEWGPIGPPEGWLMGEEVVARATELGLKIKLPAVILRVKHLTDLFEGDLTDWLVEGRRGGQAAVFVNPEALLLLAEQERLKTASEEERFLRQVEVDLIESENRLELGWDEGDFGKNDPVLRALLEGLKDDDSVGLYLKEAARVPLLSLEKESELAKQLDAAVEAQRDLRRGGQGLKEEKRLRGIIIDGLVAREHLIRANMRLVISRAKRYRRRGVPFLDLIQEGNIGLMKAVDRFDYTRGYRFSTYATLWIDQTIMRALANQGRTVRIPIYMTDRIHKMFRIMSQFEQESGRRPTPEEIAAEMGLEPRKVRWMLKVSRRPLSLEQPIRGRKDDDAAVLGQFIEDDTVPTPIQSAEQALLREKINKVLATLTPREARILRLRFGLEDGRSYTLKEVGQRFGLTRERIRQIEDKALRRLRHPRRARQLRDYLT